MARWRRSRLRWAVAGLLVVALVAAVIVAWPLVQRYTGAAPPAQFYERSSSIPRSPGASSSSICSEQTADSSMTWSPSWSRVPGRGG